MGRRKEIWHLHVAVAGNMRAALNEDDAHVPRQQ
jgi:hypothetical protein